MRFFPSLLSLLVSSGFGWLFITRYWFYRDCIDAATSSCITPEGDNLTGGGAMWLVPALIFLIVAALVRPR
jgi:hypothetical protein